MEFYSLRQAIAIAKASQFILGQPFDQHHPEASVLCITACPYRNTLKNKFVEDYELYGTTDLTEYIEEDSFDVIVIARSTRYQEVCFYTDLQTYMENNAVKMVAA